MKVLHNIPAAAVLLSTFSFSGFAPVQAAAGAVVTKEDSSEPEVDKIVNGYVLDGPLPYQVRLTNVNGFQCGGSLISSRVVLTAAHCFIHDDDGSPSSGTWYDPPANIIQFNMYDINNPAGSGSITLSHAEQGVDVFTHPGYNPFVYPTHENDVALVILPFGVLEGEHIAYAKLNEDPDVPESLEFMFVSGWGWTSPGGPGSNILRATFVAYQQEVLQYPECSTQSQMCGYIKINGTVSSPCLGDSGGALMVASQDRDFPSPATDPLLQVGIVSHGWGNCQSISAYTRVSSFVPWIKSTACDEVGELCSSTKGKGQRQGKASASAKASKSKSSKAFSLSLI
eukprot:scaffold3999_cov138-Skeletonema_dohrnii-CCMP3373.AAC.23